MMIAPPLNGGEDFDGKSGRRTANPCEINATETSVITAAHFMSRAHTRLRWRGKKIFRGRDSFETLKRWIDLAGEATFQFPILRFRLFFPANATIDSKSVV
jgi:hypothetical protein